MNRSEDIIAGLPAAPGVYIMKDRAGQVLYVGKAVNLRERVRAYFTGADGRAFVARLPRLLGDIETVVVSNEKEALLLEHELIRRHRPRFNMKLREGKNFVYLRLDPTQRYPRLEVTRRVQQDGARYFGPYPLASALRETLRVVNRHFQLRTCSDHDPATHQRPCLLCQIAHFPSPSVFDIPPGQYRQHVEDAMLFLEGRQSELVDSLRRRMEEAAAAMQFEQAARLRDQLAAIEHTLQPQKIVSGEPIDQDAFGLQRAGGRLALYVLHVRAGRVIGGRPLAATNAPPPDSEAIADAVAAYYHAGNFIPDEVLLPLPADGMETLAEWLSERKGSPVRLAAPQEGERLELVRMSERNALQSARRADQRQAGDALEGLRRRLGLSRLPRRIECFDVSHFGGAATVASRVAMSEGAPDKTRYRRYRITAARAGDDYAAMYEVLMRRLRRGLAEGDLPDLLVVDGGKGQLACARAAMKDLGIGTINAVALAKGRPDAGLPERLFVPERKEPIILPADSPELLLLMRLRDEAHHFAIAYQRQLLRRSRTRSALQDVPGVGAARARALLRHFGSLRRLQEASPGELAQVPGIGPKMAARLHDFLHPGS